MIVIGCKLCGHLKSKYKHMKNRGLLLVLIIASLFINSCVSQKKTTLNAPKDIRDTFVYIHEGIAILNSDTIAVNSFWMSKYELTNGEYLDFLEDLKSRGLDTEYSKALPDTAQWKKQSSYGKSLTDNYLRHPAYKNYPVVNISHESAKLFCEWLTEKYNNNSENENRYIFRLPTHYEWLNAAQAGKNRPYSWNSIYLREINGAFRTNFKHIPNEILTIDKETQRPAIAKYTQGNIAFFKTDEKGEMGTNITITAPVDSYNAGISGTYNMNGNVAEMIDEKGLAVGGSWNCLGFDVQNTSVLEYEKPSPFIGFRIIMTVETCMINL
ncbi:MAG: hypothetical protein EA361_19375 [Bacteroidetes bacterium]|nr:MAG: hypothetical protein EA361_19375 [Bacteroidota bacterium]